VKCSRTISRLRLSAALAPDIEALGKTIFVMWSILLRLPPSGPLGSELEFLF
jgi:hypothetical protein